MRGRVGVGGGDASVCPLSNYVVFLREGEGAVEIQAHIHHRERAELSKGKGRVKILLLVHH
jgi:hypothetical protein